jgi:hypothetical protein
MPKLTVGEKAARIKFVLDRVGTTMSRRDLTEAVANEFGVSTRSAQDIFNDAMDSITDVDPLTQRRNRSMVIEKLTNLMKAFQLDIDTLQKWITQCETENLAVTEAMTALSQLDEESDEFDILAAKIRKLPKHKIALMAGLVAEKGRLRANLVKTLSDMARIYGLYTEMPLIQAIQVMANSELLPPELAMKLSGTINGLQRAIEDEMKKVIPAKDKPSFEEEEYTEEHLN